MRRWPVSLKIDQMKSPVIKHNVRVYQDEEKKREITSDIVVYVYIYTI